MHPCIHPVGLAASRYLFLKQRIPSTNKSELKTLNEVFDNTVMQIPKEEGLGTRFPFLFPRLMTAFEERYGSPWTDLMSSVPLKYPHLMPVINQPNIVDYSPEERLSYHDSELTIHLVKTFDSMTSAKEKSSLYDHLLNTLNVKNTLPTDIMRAAIQVVVIYAKDHVSKEALKNLIRRLVILKNHLIDITKLTTIRTCSIEERKELALGFTADAFSQILATGLANREKQFVIKYMSALVLQGEIDNGPKGLSETDIDDLLLPITKLMTPTKFLRLLDDPAISSYLQTSKSKEMRLWKETITKRFTTSP